MAASGGAALVFSAVPAARIHHALPEVLPYTVTCGGSEGSRLTLKEPFECDYLADLDTVLFNVTSCEPCRSDGWVMLSFAVVIVYLLIRLSASFRC